MFHFLISIGHCCPFLSLMSLACIVFHLPSLIHKQALLHSLIFPLPKNEINEFCVWAYDLYPPPSFFGHTSSVCSLLPLTCKLTSSCVFFSFKLCLGEYVLSPAFLLFPFALVSFSFPLLTSTSQQPCYFMLCCHSPILHLRLTSRLSFSFSQIFILCPFQQMFVSKMPLFPTPPTVSHFQCQEFLSELLFIYLV